MDGYVVPCDINTGPVANRGPRNPLSELRTVELVAGEGLPEGRLATNEHWTVIGGRLHFAVDQRQWAVVIVTEFYIAGIEAGLTKDIKYQGLVHGGHGQSSAAQVADLLHGIAGAADDAQRALLELRTDDREVLAGVYSGRGQRRRRRQRDAAIPASKAASGTSPAWPGRCRTDRPTRS